jgi:hypothetical protein
VKIFSKPKKPNNYSKFTRLCKSVAKVWQKDSLIVFVLTSTTTQRQCLWRLFSVRLDKILILYDPRPEVASDQTRQTGLSGFYPVGVGVCPFSGIGLVSDCANRKFYNFFAWCVTGKNLYIFFSLRFVNICKCQRIKSNFLQRNKIFMYEVLNTYIASRT